MKPRKFPFTLAVAASAVLLSAPVLQAASLAAKPAQIQAALDGALTKYAKIQEGKNADYIPALAKVDPNIYGIVLVTADGKVYTAGDVKSQVSIQSISKVFTMARMIQDQGSDAIEGNMGVDVSRCRRDWLGWEARGS